MTKSHRTALHGAVFLCNVGLFFPWYNARVILPFKHNFPFHLLILCFFFKKQYNLV